MQGSLSHSRIQLFKQCRRRYWLNYEQRIKPAHDSQALRVGSIGHSALEFVLNGGSIDDAVYAIRGTYQHLDHESISPTIDYEREMLVGLVRGYCERWQSSNLQPVVCELEFSIPLRHPDTEVISANWDLLGYLDAIVVDEYGSYGVMEHKFYSEDLSDANALWQRVAIDPQVALYVHAARELGYPVNYVVYDVIRKPAIKIPQIPVLDEDGKKVVRDRSGNRVFTKSGTPRQTSSTADGFEVDTIPMSAEEYGIKVYEYAISHPDFHYRRKRLSILDDEIHQFLLETWDVQKDISEAHRDGRFYRNVSRDTCAWCPYFVICANKLSVDNALPEGFRRTPSHSEQE